MAPDDRTRLVPPPADDQTRDPSGGATVDRSPSGVRVAPESDGPSNTALRVSESHDGEPAPPVFEHYQLLGELGRGGMGVVYRALDTLFMRDVAVKVLSDRLVGNPSAERRFLEEARVTGQLTHTSIPPVHQIGRLPDGRQFLVMKLIKGSTLGERLKARPNLADGLADHLGALERVCLGVGYAHSRGVIHRDLKPANVMVGAFGEVLVMDWGLAKETASRERERPEAEQAPAAHAPGSPNPDAPPDTVLRDVRPAGEEFTRAGTILGTPAYMAPEQAVGDPQAVGPRSDVFSLGAILCVVLTGQPPYTGKTANEVALKAINWETADAFRRLGHSTADPLVVDLCKRCLAKDPAHRPANGEVVAKELAEIRATAAERLRRADLAEMARLAKAQESKRRRRWQIGLAAAVACIVAIVAVAAGGVVYQERRVESVRRNAENRLEETTKDLLGKIALAHSETGAMQQRFDEHKLAEAKRKEQESEAQRKAGEQRANEERTHREAGVSFSLQQVTAALADVRTAKDDAAWDAALTRAKDAHQRAWDGVQVGDGLREIPKTALGDRVIAAGPAVALAEGDRQVVAAVETIGVDVLDRNEFEYRALTPADRYRTAFHKWRQVSEQTPGEFAERVKEHPRPSVLIAAVFDWYHAQEGDRKLLADLLDRITPADPFLSRWWSAWRDASPAGTGALLALAASEQASRLSPWPLDRVCGDLWDRGERDTAIRLLRDGVDRHATSFRLHARLALRLGTPDTPATRTDAIAHATAALLLRPEAVNLRILLARLSAEQSGDPAAALRHLDRGLREREGAVGLLLERAAVYTRLKQVLRAEADYAAAAAKGADAVKRNANDPWGHRLLGRIAAERGNWAEAAGHAERAVKLRSGDPDLWYELGACHANNREPANAANAFARVIELRPTDRAAHLQLGRQCLLSGDAARGYAHLRAACGLGLPPHAR